MGFLHDLNHLLFTMKRMRKSEEILHQSCRHGGKTLIEAVIGKSSHQRNGTGGVTLNFQPTVVSTPFPKNPENEKNSHDHLISRSRSERKHKHEASNKELPVIEHENMFNQDDFWKSPEDVDLNRSFQSFSTF